MTLIKDAALNQKGIELKADEEDEIRRYWDKLQTHFPELAEVLKKMSAEMTLYGTLHHETRLKYEQILQDANRKLTMEQIKLDSSNA